MNTRKLAPVAAIRARRADTRSVVSLPMITATIRPTFGYLGTPSGTVIFFDGSNVLGTETLNGNKATFTSSTLSIGKHQIKAHYLGDGTFVPTHSKRLAQKVRADN